MNRRESLDLDRHIVGTEMSIEPGEFAVQMADDNPVSELKTLCQWVELSCIDIENALRGDPLTVRVMELRHAARKVGEAIGEGA